MLSKKVVVKSLASHKQTQVPKIASKHIPTQVPREIKKLQVNIKRK